MANTEQIQPTVFSCPVPLAHKDKVILGHGSGGKLSHDLINKYFYPSFENPELREGNDAAIVNINDFQIAYSTDSHVVWPLFFPGGDIGRLAVCGTVNDIAMMGADPLFLTAGFILEEGLDFSILECVINSMKIAAQEAGIKIVSGDTKVVQKGKADGLYINSSAIGIRKSDIHISGSNAQVGDIVIVSGTIGDHGIAVLQARGDFGFSSNIKSDIAPLNKLVNKVIEAGKIPGGNAVHVLRDPTRGGLATTLKEISIQSKLGIHLEEKKIPIRTIVNAACEILGFDPLYIANEGKMVIVVGKERLQEVMLTLHNDPYGIDASIIGTVSDTPPDKVLLKTEYGSTRVIDMLSNEMLPRIC